MRGVVVVLVAAVGCYAPSPPANVPCGDGMACPSGQTCREGICRVGGGNDVDAPTVRDAAPDGALDAALTCVVGDNKCLVGCSASDPDCVTTCGDGRCVGNAPETCGGCPADCATMAVVCGNAHCEPGEAPDCYADCGPTPWTWASEEATLVALINNVRTSGHTCPGGQPVTRPAYTVDAAMLAGAREWSWEIGHHDYHPNNMGAACNGRTLAQRKVTAGNFNAWLYGWGYATTQAAFDDFMLDPGLCATIMSPGTRVAAAVAFGDANKAFVVLVK